MGLDENLPSFYLSTPSESGSRHECTYLHARGGNEPQPTYTLKHPDPSSPAAQNCYAAALFDAYSPEILYGEVLINPKWTQPTLSQEEIRRNGGVPPPPEPIMPSEFTIQLYNPEVQIEVRRETATFGGAHYDFSMPQDTFRLPSGSMLDRTQDGPAAAGLTPKVNFSFKRDGKLTKDMVLCMKGRSTDIVHKKKCKEPDISIALFKSLREVTIYEPNLQRVDMEDPKGLEVTTLLVATVIRDVFNGQLRQAFNVNEDHRRRTSSGAGKEGATLQKEPRPGALSKPQTAMMSGGLNTHAAVGGLYAQPNGQQPRPHAKSEPGQPITDPRTQWQIDSETARLKAEADAEAAQARRQDEARRREQARRDDAESKRLMKQLETEEKDRRRREREVEKETERLRKIYGNQASLSSSAQPAREGTQSAPIQQGPFPARPQAQPVHHRPNYPSHPQQSRPGTSQVGPSRMVNQGHSSRPQQSSAPPKQTGLRPPQQGLPQQWGSSNSSQASSSQHPHGSSFNAMQAGASVGNFLGVGGGHGHKKSMFNLRSKSEDQNRLTKKTSSVW